MTTETAKIEGEGLSEPDNQTDNTPQYTEAEQKALDLGWRPKDEFEGEADDFVTAKEFIRRGELFGRINSYKNKIDALERSIKALASHNEKMFENTYKKELTEIKVARKQALREGDVDVVEALDERLESVEKEFEEKRVEVQKEIIEKPQAGPHPAWEPWAEQNRWYTNDAELRGYADGLSAKIVQDSQAAGTQVEFEKLLSEISRKVKQKFPEKFPAQTERKRTVERDTGEAKSRAAGLDADLRDVENSLTEGDKEIMNNLVRNKVLTKKAYLEQIKEYNKKKGK